MVSHSRVVDSMKREARDEERKVEREEVEEVRRSVRKTQQSVERATLGDLDVLAQLKQQFGSASSDEDGGEDDAA